MAINSNIAWSMNSDETLSMRILSGSSKRTKSAPSTSIEVALTLTREEAANLVAVLDAFAKSVPTPPLDGNSLFLSLPRNTR